MPIASEIFFVPKIYPSKVGVIGVLTDKGVKRHQKHIIYVHAQHHHLLLQKEI